MDDYIKIQGDHFLSDSIYDQKNQKIFFQNK